MPPSTTTPIAPGAWLGLLGGGQLGRMFCMAAQSLGYKVCVLDPGHDSPAGAVADDHSVCRLSRPSPRWPNWRAAAARRLPSLKTFPPRHSRSWRSTAAVSPDAASVAIAQDRIDEKRFLAASGIEVAPHAVISERGGLRAARRALLPGILKSATARLRRQGPGARRHASPRRARLGGDGRGAVRARADD